MAASHRRILALLSFFAFLACGQALAQKPAGLPGGYPRLPLRPLTDEKQLAEIRKGLERFGVPHAPAVAKAAE